MLDLLDLEKSYVVDDGEAKSEIFSIEIAMPETKQDIKAFMKDSNTWVSRKLKKGAEMKWQEIPVSRSQGQGSVALDT